VVGLVKVYTPRRLREKNRWLRSDGKPNFKDRLYSKEPELSPLVRKDVPSINTLTTVLRTCEIMSSYNTRLTAVTSGKGNIIGVVTAMDIVDYLGGGSKHGLVGASGFETIYEVLNLSIGKIMNDNPIYVSIDTPLYKVLELMINHGLGAVPVTKEDDSYAGVLTELEIMKYLSVKYVGMPVHKVMTREVLSVNSSTSLEEAMWMMVSLGVRRLPVIDENQIKGMLTWKDVVDLIGTHKIYEMLKYGLLREFKSLRVSDVMNTNVDVVSPYADLGEVASMILRTATSSLLVVEGGVVVGIITERDVIYGLVVS